MRQIKIASLFAGCGGTDVGFSGGFQFLGRNYKRHPVKLIYALDFDKHACDLFDRNFPVSIQRTDILDTRGKEHEIPDHDILTAGFPCQSFSIIAQNPKRLGVKSEQGQLFFEICRILKAKHPVCFVAENVKGILTANKGEAFPLIMQHFRECGYHVVHMLLDAYHYGVPQRRKRVFIVGFRDVKHLDAFRPPCPVEFRTHLREVIFPESEILPKYYFSNKAIHGLKKAKKEMNKGRVQSIDGPCATVGAHLAKVSINSTDPVLKPNGLYRRFTPREVARIQSFPDEFKLNGSDGHQYRALGNAIPPVLAWHVANSVICALK